jgi:chromosome segregation ATPase
MEKQVEKLEESLIGKIKELRQKQTDLVVNIGQLHLELKQLQSVVENMESDYFEVTNELNGILNDLEKKYPAGEVDLLDGTVTY